MYKSIQAKDTNESAKEHLKTKIVSKRAIIAVIGLGYVGLPLAVEKAKVGFKVLGIDQNQSRVDMINQGQNYISDVKDNELQELVTTRKITAYSDFDILPVADVVVICVPTPLTKNMEPDISYILNVTRYTSKCLR